jgi:hypothetical protein
MPPQPKKKPGQRSPRPIATHITVQEELDREKRLYVVREPGWDIVWGANLSYERALHLKHRTAGRMRSSTVMMEPMPTDPDLLSLCATADTFGSELPPTVALPSPEVIAKQKAAKAAAEAKRVKAQADKTLLEAQRRAQLAQEHANKLMADAQKAAAAAAAGTPEDPANPPNGVSEEEIDPALLAESEALAEASLEDILAD